MWGAIIGDLAGSIYEFNQVNSLSLLNVYDVIPENAFFSDDTILTIAVLDAILNDKNYEYYLKKYALEYSDYKPLFEPYFKTPFSPSFMKWANGDINGISKGNGAMMRISPVGYLCDNDEDLIKNVYEATRPSHNSNEAFECALVVARVIYLARLGYSKDKIISTLNLNFSYRNFEKFNSTCSETIDNCLYALFSSSKFSEAICKVISYGGDTDTNACIVGSMAEALYGIDEDLISMARSKIPLELSEILNKGYSLIKKI